MDAFTGFLIGSGLRLADDMVERMAIWLYEHDDDIPARVGWGAESDGYKDRYRKHAHDALTFASRQTGGPDA